MSEISQSAPASAVDENIKTVGEALQEPMLGNDAAQPTPFAAVESAEVTPGVEGPTDAGENKEFPGAPAGIPESAAVIEGTIDTTLLNEPAQAIPAEMVAADALPVDEAVAVAEAVVAEESAAEAEGDDKRVVRTLAVGQEVMGTVKRVSDFGAFVDIGVGRDGLVHISELSVKRVGKVTDILNEGQVVPMWIKKLDRERNRISLTMIPPGTKTLRDVNQGDIVTGTVTRILPYGAFVDIGVGRDGLVHISELSIKRVGKVTDVLNEGQVVPMWIKKLDRERNRISLTMIPPGTKTLRDVNQGDIVTGTVTRILPHGAFVDIGVGRDALLHVREMGERYIAKPEEVVTVGEELEARIIEVQRRRGRIDLSIKGLRPEPEVESSPYSQQEQSGQGGSGYQGGSSHQGGQSYSEPTAQVDAAPEPVDQFADMEMPSAMELALRKAMDQSGVELKISKKKDKQRAEQKRKQQEDIYERTLKSSGK